MDPHLPRHRLELAPPPNVSIVDMSPIDGDHLLSEWEGKGVGQRYCCSQLMIITIKLHLVFGHPNFGNANGKSRLCMLRKVRNRKRERDTKSGARNRCINSFPGS
jgi:hypothetical protein